MRELSNNEIDAVSGGVIDVIGPIGGISLGIRLGAVGAVLTASYYAGYAVGTAIYNTYTYFRY